MINPNPSVLEALSLNATSAFVFITYVLFALMGLVLIMVGLRGGGGASSEMSLFIGGVFLVFGGGMTYHITGVVTERHVEDQVVAYLEAEHGMRVVDKDSVDSGLEVQVVTPEDQRAELLVVWDEDGALTVVAGDGEQVSRPVVER